MFDGGHNKIHVLFFPHCAVPIFPGLEDCVICRKFHRKSYRQRSTLLEKRFIFELFIAETPRGILKFFHEN